MCVIIYKDKKTNIDFETIKQALTTNPDGLGVAINDGTSWTIYKYMYPTDREIKTLLKKMQDKECVLHCRIATSGEINLKNCHPFLFDDNKQVLFQNGVIYGLNGISSKKSDTRLLIDILNNPDNDAHEILLNLADKTTNKFVLIDENNSVHFYGDFKNYRGLLCSNLNFVPRPIVPITAQEQEKIYKTYDEFFKDRRTMWDENDILTQF